MGERSADPDPLDALRRLETIDETNADEAARLLAQARRLPAEVRVIDHLLFFHARRPLPEPLLVDVASALLDRGDEKGAAATLARASSTPALMLRAESLARGGDLERAVALVERALLRDLDFPGAREKHARWCAVLGRRPRAASAARGDGARTDVRASFAGGPSGLSFRLVREVARGGTGTVYEAEDADLGRPIALKVYHHPERDRAQLTHEARVAVALAGPGIVRVWDVDVQKGWLAMQWAPRGVLGARCREAAGPATFGPWMLGLARALARVHAAGWTHLDVKPANVLLHADDGVVLTDFGAARRIGEPSPPGSLGYVAPERMAGGPADPRDDVYAFGRVLEDFLDRAPRASSDAGTAAWRALATDCTGPDAGRPPDGQRLLERIAVL